VVRFAHEDLLYERLAGGGSAVHGEIIKVRRKQVKRFYCSIYYGVIFL